MTAKELREKRAAIATRIKELAAKSNADHAKFESEDRQNWIDVNKDYDAMTVQIELAERAEKVEGEQRAVTPKIILPGRDNVDARAAMEDANRQEGGNDNELTDDELGINVRSIKPEVFGLALQGWLRRQSGLDVEQRHLKAAKLCNVNLFRSHLDINLQSRAMTMREHRAAMSAIDQSAGGSTVVPTFANSFETAMLTFGGMRQAAEVMRTETGAELTWPTANDTGNTGHIVGENVQVVDTPIATNAVKWGAHKYTLDCDDRHFLVAFCG